LLPLPATFLATISRALVRFGSLLKRRKQHELLEDEWRELGCYSKREKDQEMVLDDFGTAWDGATRRSKRIAKNKLIKYI
jgi:hypothetical protein